MVLMGAEGVVENGGIINKLGSFQIATVAKAMGKPVYVAAESYKFARLYPLNQRDLPNEHSSMDLGLKLPEGVRPLSHHLPTPRWSLRPLPLCGTLTPAADSSRTKKGLCDGRSSGC